MKFQINLRLKDLSAMANVKQFSDINVPLLWFDIVSSTVLGFSGHETNTEISAGHV